MSGLLSTTNSLHDWIGITGLILAAAGGLVWRMHVLWQTAVRRDVDDMIMKAKLELISKLEDQDKKTESLLDLARAIDKTAEKGMIRLDNMDGALSRIEGVKKQQ